MTVAKILASVLQCWIETQRLSFGWSRRAAFIAFPGKGGHSGLMTWPENHVTHPGGVCEEFYSVQGTGHDQLMDSSWIGCHQDEVSSSFNLLVATSLGSMFLWSEVFIWGRGLLLVKNKIRIHIKPLSVSFSFLKDTDKVILLYGDSVI